MFRLNLLGRMAVVGGIYESFDDNAALKAADLAELTDDQKFAF